jgi:hypothetical protein
MERLTTTTALQTSEQIPMQRAHCIAQQRLEETRSIDQLFDADPVPSRPKLLLLETPHWQRPRPHWTKSADDEEIDQIFLVRFSNFSPPSS